MSASPSGVSNGQTPTPNGGPPQFVRKPKPADPLRPRKRPVRRPNLPPALSGAPKPNGLTPAARPNQAPQNGSAPVRGFPPQQVPAPPPKASASWTQPPQGPFYDFPLVTTKRALREQFRYHIARFASKREVDPTDQEEFTRPVVLHRRDPRQPPVGKAGKDGETPVDEPVDSKEREKLEILKAEKEARRAADLAQIAPTGNNAIAPKAKPFRNEKTTQVFRMDKTGQDKKQSDLKYEEALPWHLEDADGKNTWVGNYEAALSEMNVIFVIEGQTFKMIPIEKWYKFTQKGQFKTFTIEEAESRLSKGAKESRWAMKTQEKKMAEARSTESQFKLFKVKAETESFKSASKREIQDIDDLDFEADDLFQDDDEMATVEPDNDEETKEAQDRIKREQLGANIFDQAIEADIDQELHEEEKEEEERKKLGKGVKKALKKREKNWIYESDSSNPYSSSSDDDTSDEEKQKEIDKRKDEEAKNKIKMESKLPSGASSKGTNTPSGRPKHSDPLKKAKSLKRPGSPNLSESSGNESSRKKHKKKHQSSATGTSTPIPGSRPMSPAPSSSQSTNQSPRKSSIIKLKVPGSNLSEIQSAQPNPSPIQGGAMSDGEATGGEMSDGGKKAKTIKLRIGTSPAGSRSGTPAPGRSGSTGAGGSRAGSPSAQSQTAAPTTSRAQSPSTGSIQPHEIVAALPPSGITIGNLMKIFDSRIKDARDQPAARKEFIRMVKENAAYGPDKLLRPK